MPRCATPRRSNPGAIDRILLHVAHELEDDGSRPRNGDEGETALAEDGLGHCILVLRRGVEDRIV